jgi:hypothetical protein
MSEWISVKERLPEVSSFEHAGDVIVFPGFYGRPYVGSYYPILKEWGQPNVTSAIFVSHWMLLPAPPKKDSE